MHGVLEARPMNICSIDPVPTGNFSQRLVKYLALVVASHKVCQS